MIHALEEKSRMVDIINSKVIDAWLDPETLHEIIAFKPIR